jgi:hypothetical protein
MRILVEGVRSIGRGIAERREVSEAYKGTNISSVHRQLRAAFPAEVRERTYDASETNMYGKKNTITNDISEIATQLETPDLSALPLWAQNFFAPYAQEPLSIRSEHISGEFIFRANKLEVRIGDVGFTIDSGVYGGQYGGGESKPTMTLLANMSNRELRREIEVSESGVKPNVIDVHLAEHAALRQQFAVMKPAERVRAIANMVSFTRREIDKASASAKEDPQK